MGTPDLSGLCKKDFSSISQYDTRLKGRVKLPAFSIGRAEGIPRPGHLIFVSHNFSPVMWETDRVQSISRHRSAFIGALCIRNPESYQSFLSVSGAFANGPGRISVPRWLPK